VGDRNVVPQHTGERRRVGVVAGNGARLELRPLILRHLAIQIAQLLAARQRCRAGRRELSSIRCGAASVAELIAYAKANPGKLRGAPSSDDQAPTRSSVTR
jgi:hypothetical protein